MNPVLVHLLKFDRFLPCFSFKIFFYSVSFQLKNILSFCRNGIYVCKIPKHNDSNIFVNLIFKLYLPHGLVDPQLTHPAEHY